MVWQHWLERFYFIIIIFNITFLYLLHYTVAPLFCAKYKTTVTRSNRTYHGWFPWRNSRREHCSRVLCQSVKIYLPHLSPETPPLSSRSVYGVSYLCRRGDCRADPSTPFRGSLTTQTTFTLEKLSILTNDVPLLLPGWVCLHKNELKQDDSDVS